MRILIASDAAPDAERARVMVEQCGLEALEAKTLLCDLPRVALPPPGAYDALIVAGACTSEKAHALIDSAPPFEQRGPLVFLVPELTPPVATLAHQVGARMCLFEHGPVPLREAIIHEAERFAARREEEHRIRRELNDSACASERARALVNVNVTDVVFSLQVEGDRFRFVEVNPAFTETTGLAADQVLGKLVDEVIPEPSRSLVVWKYREALAQRRTVQWDEVTDYPKGKRYGHVSVTPIIDFDGRCSTLLGTVHDVTEEKSRTDQLHEYGSIVDAVQIGLTVWRVDGEGPTLRLRAANPAAERIAGEPLAARLGEPSAGILADVMAPQAIELLRGVARTGEVRELAELQSASDPRRYFSLKAFPLGEGAVGLAFEDVSEEAGARSLMAAEKRILEMVASGDELERTLTELAIEMERHAPPAIASVLLVSSDGKRLQHGAAPHLPERYNRAIDGLAVGPKVGSCGSAVALKRSIVVTDIEVDPYWEDYRELARAHGLRACWSTPILSADDRVLGTFALYYREPRAPAQADLDVIARATHVAGIAISRHELEEQLRQLSARLEAAREEERTGIARELHDQLGQSLTALKLELAWLSRRVSESGGRQDVCDKVRESMQMADELIHELRRISAELRPALLDDLGLVSALRWQAKEFASRTGIECVVRSNVTDEAVSHELGTTVFRVVQEALTNVARHAGAHRVEVRLEASAGTLMLEVSDDGRGIGNVDIRHPASLGLLGIRERARRVGGSVTLGATVPHGTVMTLRLPLENGRAHGGNGRWEPRETSP